MKLFISCLVTLVILISSLAFVTPKNDEINWVTFEEAQKLNKQKPKKIIVDLYTNWCGWCKKLDASTYKHPVIVKYINQNYYAVKFNAETKDTISFNGNTYINTSGTHKLALFLLNNKQSYPTTAFIDEQLNYIQAVPGYMDAKTFEPVINYFAQDAYKSIPWDNYYENFNGTVR